MKRVLFFVMVIVLLISCIVVYGEDEYTNDLIPAMTSNTTPEGEVISNTDPGGGINGSFTSFDDTVVGSGWCATLPAWIGYEFSSNKKISQYTLTSYPTQNPTDWTFEAWDGNVWIILDTQSNVNSWGNYEKKTFVFNNTSSYLKYRINITSGNVTYNNKIYLYEIEMMEKTSSLPDMPTNLVALGEQNQITLSWNEVQGASSYALKRSTTSGGTYSEIANSITSTSFIDTSVVNGITYYYIVTAINENGESENSNEVSAKLVDPIVCKSTIILTLTDSIDKEYKTTTDVINNFIDWYDGRLNGSGKGYFIFNKYSEDEPYSSRKEYIIFDKIISFEVMEY